MSNILDMSLGNPEFLHPYWDKLNTLAFLDLSKDLNYKYGSLNSLKHNIKSLHKMLSNANVADKHIVIGNGVTQIINGLLNISGNPLVYADPPHYHRFPDFTRLNNKLWVNHPNAIKLITLPNNPTGDRICNSQIENIYDLNYNWPQYINSIYNYDFDVMIFGLSKALGLSSARIGWAIIRDEKLAKELEKYVELTTGGVSIYSQKIANRLIKKQLVLDETVFEYGKKVLASRWYDVMWNVKLPFKVLNHGSGLFLWCEGEIPKNITVFPGSMFGVTDDFFRINLGVSKIIWEQFKELYGT